MLRRPVLAPLLAALLLCTLATLSACAHRAADESASAASDTASAAPPGSKLAKVRDGMSDSDVRLILGAPTTVHTYMTGKMFIPFYYGTDTRRTEWEYRGTGRITFSDNQYTGALKVIRVEYDPNEPGS